VTSNFKEASTIKILFMQAIEYAKTTFKNLACVGEG
jgi:hypothetical protein